MRTAASGTGASARDTLAALNIKFHLEILEASGNERLKTLASSLVRIVAASVFERYSENDVSRSTHHHGELVAAFRAKDGDWAESVMRAHLLLRKKERSRMTSTAIRILDSPRVLQ